jgi:RimJ/RimL family protein N-acetyltransferase
MIYGSRIRLRAVERSDLPLFVDWLNYPEVRRGLAQHRPFSLVEEERWFEKMLERPVDEHPMVIEIPDGDAWRPIGDCSYVNIDWRNRLAEVGIFIGDVTCWNQGYGSEAMGLLLRHAFDTLNLNRIFLRVFENNQRAIRCYEKVGFIHEGRLRQAEYRDGKFLDVLLMSVLRQEWQRDG